MPDVSSSGSGRNSGTGPTLTLPDVAVGDEETLLFGLVINAAVLRNILTVTHGGVAIPQLGNIQTSGRLRLATYRAYHATQVTGSIVATMNGNCSAVGIFYSMREILDAIHATPGATGTSTAPNAGTTGPIVATKELIMCFAATREYGDGTTGLDPGPSPGVWGAGIIEGLIHGSLDLADPCRLSVGLFDGNGGTAYAPGKTGLDAAVQWAAAAGTFPYPEPEPPEPEPEPPAAPTHRPLSEYFKHEMLQRRGINLFERDR